MSLVASSPLTSTTDKVMIGVFFLIMATAIINRASPMRLTRLLVAAIKDAEKTYLDAIEAGILSKSDVDAAAILSSLQIKVSTIRQESLRNSLSTRQEFREFCKGRSITILKCIREVRKFEADIEILNEEHLRAPDLGVRIGMVSLRQRRTHTSSSKSGKCPH
ncbi:hypothetical protein C8R44DRAFT_879367 [Mycena epipterygia]|nr:hypothetical protein C8R44DRAFT_879367 [Mycena epipterygia]